MTLKRGVGDNGSPAPPLNSRFRGNDGEGGGMTEKGGGMTEKGGGMTEKGGGMTEKGGG